MFNRKRNKESDYDIIIRTAEDVQNAFNHNHDEEKPTAFSSRKSMEQMADDLRILIDLLKGPTKKFEPHNTMIELCNYYNKNTTQIAIIS